MKPTTMVAVACWFCGGALGATYELPRASSTMPVNASVECVAAPEGASACTVSRMCADAGAWAAGIETTDFDVRSDVDVGSLGWLPWSSSSSLSCAVHVEGEASIIAYRMHRERGDDEWIQLSPRSCPSTGRAREPSSSPERRPLPERVCCPSCLGG